jgi:hypothetical protein
VEIEVMAGCHEHWVSRFVGLAEELRGSNVPKESIEMMKLIFEPMAQRINQLHSRVVAK